MSNDELKAHLIAHSITIVLCLLKVFGVITWVWPWVLICSLIMLGIIFVQIGGSCLD